MGEPCKHLQYERAASANCEQRCSPGLLTQGVLGVPQDPFALRRGPLGPSPDRKSPIENAPALVPRTLGSIARSRAAHGVITPGARSALDPPTPGPGLRGRLSGLSVSHSKRVFYGAFVWAHRALNSQKWRFPARPVFDASLGAFDGAYDAQYPPSGDGYGMSTY